MNIYFCHLFRQLSSLLWRTRKLVVEEDDILCYKSPNRNFLVYDETPNVFLGLHFITHYMNAEVSFASSHLMASWVGPGSLKVWKCLSLSFFLLLFFLFSKKGFPCGSKSMLAVLSTSMTRLHQQTFRPFYPTVLYCREHKIINISFWKKLQGDFKWMSEGMRFIQS